MTSLAKYLFLYSSYSPLFLLFAVKVDATDRNLTVETLFACAAVLGAVAFWVLKRHMATGARVHVALRTFERKDDNMLSYAITYFPPLFAIDLPLWHYFAAIGLVYLIVIVVFARLDAYYVNPFFVFAGYRIWKITGADDQEMVAIVRGATSLRQHVVLSGPYTDGIVLAEG